MCTFDILVTIFLYTILYARADLRTNPLVDTNVGQIRGLSADDGDYSLFMGIPYARVTQDNPFAEAIPQEPFDDAFEAYNDTAVCPQIDEYTNELAGTLDCLHLNVYVPNSANSQNHLPVLVWIHGGRFAIGSGGRFEFGPKYLVRHDVILVTVNYRLGPYGFMCLDTPEVPGNQGLKDQYLALKWVKDNIEAFGGDPEQITIFGESAGSMSIDFHIHAPREKVFNKAIMQSGTSQTITFHAPVLDTPLRLAQYLGYETEDIDSAISFLANSDPDSVITAADALNIIFRPCVEKEFANVDRFITQNWITAIPNVYDMPVLIGFNSQEELLEDEFYDDLVRDKLAIGFDIEDVAFEGMEDIVKRYYIGDEPITEAVREEMVTFQSDYKFNHPTFRTVGKYMEHGAGNFYVFSYVGGRNFARFHHPNVTLEGAAHADELGYLFDVSFLPEPTAQDQLVIDRMTTMWTNFAKYSEVTPARPEQAGLLPSEWAPVTAGSPLHYLDIDRELTIDTRPFSSRMTFWDLFYKTNRDLQRIYPGYNVGHNRSSRLFGAKFGSFFLLLIALIYQ